MTGFEKTLMYRVCQGGLSTKRGFILPVRCNFRSENASSAEFGDHSVFLGPIKNDANDRCMLCGSLQEKMDERTGLG